MRVFFSYIISFVILIFSFILITSCDKQDDVVSADTERLTLKFSYDQTENLFSNQRITKQQISNKEEQLTGSEQVRVVVRAYPIVNRKRAEKHTFEKSFTRTADGCDFETIIDLPLGEYEILAWSDFLVNGSPLHNAEDFSEVTFSGDHIGCSFCREAFRGSAAISIFGGDQNNHNNTYEIVMKKPLARFELLTDDLAEFLTAEVARRKGEEVNIDDYVVAFYYVGFMPIAYSLFKDAPVDSTTGMMFTSTLKPKSETEASLGFDYVFVNNKDSAVTIRIGVYDNDGYLVSLTQPIKVPLKRNNVTALRGSFITHVSSDGILIDRDFKGDYNLFL